MKNLSVRYSYPTSVFKDTAQSTKVTILNVDIDNISRTALLRNLDQGIIFTPNVDHLIRLQHDLDFFQAYQMATYRICDSTILQYSARFLGYRAPEKISGSDLLPAFCDYHATHQQVKLFLLGGDVGVPQQAQAQINQRVKRNMVVQAHSPSYGFEHNHAECQEIIEMINQSQANVLVVGVGAPKQELWITKYKDQMPNVKIFMALGATIDFMAGHKSRAPQWMSQVGLEWMYRLCSEPRRLWKRYLIDDMPFFGLILRQKLGIYKSPLKWDPEDY